MQVLKDMSKEMMEVDVAIVGSGPAGLAAATQLRLRGVDRVVVLDRETEAGGIPRHCGHLPFGMREFYRILTGPQYAKKLVATAISTGVKILTHHTVTCLRVGGKLDVTTPEGQFYIQAKRVLIATGVRETPRSARLVAGSSPLGITTTGALQSMFYLKGLVPFKKPVVIGTELVAFSSLITASNAGIQPVAMIESGSRVSARNLCGLIPFFKRVPLLLNTELEEIIGITRVEGVSVKNTNTGESRVIQCDGVIFTGKFTPDSALAQMSHLEVDHASEGLKIDQFGRCSDPAYFAAGNVLRPVETAGWSYQEGRSIGGWIADDLKATPCFTNSLKLVCEDPVRLVVPQVLIPTESGGFKYLQLRVNRVVKGELVVDIDNKIVWRKKLSTLPERRILIPISVLNYTETSKVLRVYFKE